MVMRPADVAWITGAGSGIGEACALAFARAGYRVALTGRRADPLEGVAARLRADDRTALVCTGDVSNPDVVDGLATRVAAFGRLACVVNAAGGNVAERRWDQLTPDAIRSLVDLNLVGALYVTQAALPAMRAGGGGTFVHIGSWTAHFPSTLAGPVYMAAKTATVAMSHALNMEEGRNGIRSCVLSPGETVTPLMDKRPVPITPAERALMLRPEDVADLVLHVATLPPRVCVNEVIVSPTANRLHA